MAALAGVVVAVIALGVSVVALVFSKRTDDRDAILRLFDRMADSHDARRHLYAQAERKYDWWADARGEAQRNEINGSIALLDIIGYYVDREFVEQSAVIDMWAGMIAHVWEAAQPYVHWRRSSEPRLWRYLEDLYAKVPADVRRHYSDLAAQRFAQRPKTASP
jgi:hypothetical protein